MYHYLSVQKCNMTCYKFGMENQIQKYRKRSGLSQEQLAAKLDVTRVTVGRWERHEIEPPRTKLEKAAAIFGCRPVDLLAESSSDDSWKERFYAALAVVLEQTQSMGINLSPPDFITVMNAVLTESGSTEEIKTNGPKLVSHAVILHKDNTL